MASRLTSSGANLAKRAQHTDVGVVVLVDPQAREAGNTGHDGQVVGGFLGVDVFQQRVGLLAGSHYHCAAGPGELVDGLKPVPGPGLDALAHGVVNVDRNVDVGSLIDGEALFQFLGAVGHDRELLGRDAVTFRGVAVAPESGADLAVFPGRENDGADDVPRQALLKMPR